MAINSPEGTRDLLPDEAKFWAHFRDTAFGIFARYGYQPIETPLFEQTDLFVRGIGQATDVVSKEMFTAISGENFKRVIDGGTIKAKSRLSLRPEGTAGVVRAVVQHDLVPQGAAPAKLMYAGPMFRAERPQKGRQRMFNQVGIECLGAEDHSVDAEGIPCAPASETLDVIDAALSAACDAGLANVARSLLATRLRHRPDDALMGVLRSFGEPA